MSDYNDGILPEPCLRMNTHFGEEYESIEFGDGTGYIKAAPILAKVGALHEEIDALRDEIGFLHECIALNARDANTENAKLRELARDMWDWLAPTASNSGAPLQMIVTHMRMLGVEV